MHTPADGPAAFFNQVVAQYDTLIQRHIPRYGEMFWAMFYYLPADWTPSRILELGCGTGNLTQLLHQRWPEAHITAVDLAPAMLEATGEKIPANKRTLEQASFSDVCYALGSFDLVISSLALHHLWPEDQAQLLQRIGTWLQPGGFFVWADGFRSDSERLYQADCALWDQLSLQHGLSPDELTQLIVHRNTHDHYATVSQVLTWLTQAGLSDVEMVWRYCVWGVFQGQKPN